MKYTMIILFAMIFYSFTESLISYSGYWQLTSLCTRPQQGQRLDDRFWENDTSPGLHGAPARRPLG